MSGWLPQPQPQPGEQWVLGAVGRARGRLPFRKHPSPSRPPCRKAAWQPAEELVASAPAKGGTFASRPGRAMPKSGSIPLGVDSSVNSLWSLALKKVPESKPIIFSLPVARSRKSLSSLTSSSMSPDAAAPAGTASPGAPSSLRLRAGCQCPAQGPGCQGSRTSKSSLHGGHQCWEEQLSSSTRAACSHLMTPAQRYRQGKKACVSWLLLAKARVEL